MLIVYHVFFPVFVSWFIFRKSEIRGSGSNLLESFCLRGGILPQGLEYEYDIDPKTGAVLKVDKDWD